jgi:hypothetical protein
LSIKGLNYLGSAYAVGERVEAFDKAGYNVFVNVCGGAVYLVAKKDVLFRADEKRSGDFADIVDGPIPALEIGGSCFVG